MVKARLNRVASGGADAQRGILREGMDMPEGGLVRELVSRILAGILECTYTREKSAKPGGSHQSVLTLTAALTPLTPSTWLATAVRSFSRPNTEISPRVLKSGLMGAPRET